MLTLVQQLLDQLRSLPSPSPSSYSKHGVKEVFPPQPSHLFQTPSRMLQDLETWNSCASGTCSASSPVKPTKGGQVILQRGQLHTWGRVGDKDIFTEVFTERRLNPWWEEEQWSCPSLRRSSAEACPLDYLPDQSVEMSR